MSRLGWPSIILALIILAPVSGALVVESTPNMVLSDLEAEPGESILIDGSGPLTIRGTLRAGDGKAGQDGGSIIIQLEGLLVVEADAHFIAGDGGDGTPTTGTGTAHGQHGGDGGNVVVHASVVHGTLQAQPGDGGDGGDAYATGAPALAAAGNGGNSGRLETMAPAILLHPTKGGDGGAAQAQGTNACSNRPGPNATSQTPNATTGDAEHAEAYGGDATCARPGEDGAPGGNATAIGGNGGYTENGPGGNGGDATAIGGRGADGVDLCYGSTEEAEASGFTKAGDGGVGGTPIAIGGNGGTGVNGGRGGNAYAESHGSNGGNATMPILFGSGGANMRPDHLGEVKAGDGGTGIINGGPGGSAVGKGFSGNSGGNCGPLPYKGIPSVGPPTVILVLLGIISCKGGLVRDD